MNRNKKRIKRITRVSSSNKERSDLFKDGSKISYLVKFNWKNMLLEHEHVGIII